MNSKKSKKNRAKTANTVPSKNVTSSDSSDKIVNTEEQLQCEDIQVSEKNDRKDEITKEITQGVPEISLSIPEDSSNVENVPVKPKRKKGKKKKQDEPIDDENKTVTFEETLNQAKIETLDVQDVISDAESITKMKTKSRKKKNKTKNQIEKVSDSEEIKTEDNALKESTEVLPPTDHIGGEETTPKKKHKKKKHRSESSSECISAFQQILEPSESQDNLVPPDNTEIKDDEFIENVEVPIEPVKSKKKNKKHRKLSPAIVSQEKEEIQNDKTNILQETEEKREASSNISDEPVVKPKAIIAKPVEKKRKNKHSSVPANEEMNNFNNEIMANEKSTMEAIKHEDSENIVKKDEDVSSKADEKQIFIQPEIKIDSNVCNVKDTIKEPIENFIESDALLKEETTNEDAKRPDSIPFTEVRPSRKKKRSSKSISEQSDTEKSVKENKDTVKPSEALIDDTDITPDFIHYPRSSSQQQYDSNNNTVIQEINSPDEVRLGIPILMSIPVIEGSGESPEVRSQTDPLEVEVTELKINKPTDIQATVNKSEGNDDNQVMEELKQTIEKSLAELTAIEKCEAEAEKQFLDVLKEPLNNTIDISSETTSEKVESMPKEIETENKPDEKIVESCSPPVCPSRKDKKGKSKKKGKKSFEQPATTTSSQQQNTSSTASDTNKNSQEKSKNKEDKSESNENKGKQQSEGNKDEIEPSHDTNIPYEAYYEPIENFEDALTSSTEDINETFEMIAKEVNENNEVPTHILQKPEISITEPDDESKERNAKQTPISQPKNLLGHPNIPVSSNKADYKKEKDKLPNTKSAKVKIKDSTDIEKPVKKSKESQTPLNKLNQDEFNRYKINENDDFVYKYSFRKVFLPNICNVCNKDLIQRVPCKFCNLVFYCSAKHKDEDWSKHQSLCFAVCTISHLKEQKFIYGDAKNVTGQDYRLLRMQMIMSCEKMLKRKLLPWEQEALLYPRICADSGCREWKQSILTDCSGCGQVSYCTDRPEHLPVSHQRWCKSYALYHKLVTYQLSYGRLEPKLPNKMLTESNEIPEKINEVLASLFDEKVDMSDIEYAALTQVASAPLTTAYSHQLSRKPPNGMSKRANFSIHIVGAELQFEADSLNRWETFFLHLRPEVKDLRVTLIGADLNPSNLPLELLRKVKVCAMCRARGRRLSFSFEDKKTYREYYSSEDFVLPDIVCAFNPSIQRSSMYNGKDPWPGTLQCIAKLKKPFLITAYTLQELARDMSRVKEYSRFDIISEAKYNSFASVRPDRNFITDDEAQLLFKNYCFSVLCGA